MTGKLPNFLIIGAQKGGSTWLYEQLKQHPRIFLPARLELHHFSSDDCNTEQKLQEYARHFEKVEERHVAIGEKTPGYLWTYAANGPYCLPGSKHNRTMPQDAKAQLGSEIKLLCSLRHPVWRAISAFFHHTARGRVADGAAISAYFTKFGIIDMGFYARHLKAWMEHFPRGQFLILTMERDVIGNPKQGLAKAYKFLGVEEDYSMLPTSAPANVGSKRQVRGDRICLSSENSPYVSREDIVAMLDIFREDVTELKSMLDDPLPEWDRVEEALRRFVARPLPRSKAGLEQAHDCGVDLSPAALEGSSGEALASPPVRIADARLDQSSRIDAFSFMTSGHAHNTEIGRYCSIAREVSLGQNRPPMSWLSTNPFQYEQSLRFRCGESFAHTRNYTEFQLPQGVRRLADDAVGEGKTIIGNDVWIGHGAIVSAGVKVDDGGVIAAGAVVTKDVPAYAVVAGNPATVIHYRFEAGTIARLQESQWWQYAPWDLADLPFWDVDAALAELSARVACGYVLPYHSDPIPLSEFHDA